MRDRFELGDAFRPDCRYGFRDQTEGIDEGVVAHDMNKRRMDDEWFRL